MTNNYFKVVQSLPPSPWSQPGEPHKTKIVAIFYFDANVRSSVASAYAQAKMAARDSQEPCWIAVYRPAPEVAGVPAVVGAE